ncbi:hypothetical protein, partial [Methylomagnum sp.]
TLTVEPEPGQRLDESSLPKPGPLNRWLELRRIAVEPGPGRSLRVNLDYQTFYAPLTVKPLRIPGPTLRFEKPGGAVTATAPDWSFSMAPLHGLAVLNGDGLEPLRPDAWPEPPDTTAPLAGLGGFTLAGLGAWLYLGYGRGWFDVGRRGRPALNCAALANRPRERRRCGRVSPACIGPSLPEFLAGRVGYADLRREIEAFFRASYDLFFRDEGAVSRLDSFKNPLPPGESAARGA